MHCRCSSCTTDHNIPITTGVFWVQATVHIALHHLNWRAGAGCSWPGYTAKNSSYYQLTWHFIKLILVPNSSSNLVWFCDKASVKLRYVLCCSICLKRKRKSQSTWTVSWIRQYKVSPQSYVGKKKGNLLSSFMLRLVCCSKMKVVRHKRLFLLVTFLLVCYFCTYQGGQYWHADHSCYCQGFYVNILWVC